MIEDKYEVYADGELVASNMPIEIATLLCKAMFDEYYNNSKMELTIKKMKQPEMEQAENE